MKITKATDIQRTNNWRILIYGKAGLGKSTKLCKRLLIAGNQFSITFQRKYRLLKDKGKLKTLLILKQY